MNHKNTAVVCILFISIASACIDKSTSRTKTSPHQAPVNSPESVIKDRYDALANKDSSLFAKTTIDIPRHLVFEGFESVRYKIVSQQMVDSNLLSSNVYPSSQEGDQIIIVEESFATNAFKQRRMFYRLKITGSEWKIVEQSLMYDENYIDPEELAN